MAKVGRNSPCPCGSGEKYKRCCEKKEAAMKRLGHPPGRFRYESGSYGGPGRGYMPSIICYKELKPNSWKEHFCLVKPDGILNDENAASSIAEKHLAAAQTIIATGEDPQDFALKLRHEGYKNVTDFRVVNE